MTSDKPQKNSRRAPTGSSREKPASRPVEKQGGESSPLAHLSDSDLHADTVYQPGETPRSGNKQTESVNLVGKQLGDFKILRRLGQGGMATVYLAEQVSLKREAAIKVMHSELMSDETHVRRFEREAKAAAGLTHPNIVQVYMTGDFDGTHYIAQEYVRGVNLKEYLARNAPPDCALILKIMRQVTAALHAAAEKGIVHRDIKPENIMITSRKLIKVADFGLAQIAQAEERVHLTQVGTTMGTPLYMSPEQVNGKALDQRSDIYSLGVTCYHLISGRPPFHGETALSIAVKHLNEAAPSLKNRRPDLPEELCDLVHRMMEKDPDKRPANASALMQEIRKIPEQPATSVKRDWRSWLPFQGNQGLQKQLATFLLASLCLGSVAAAVGWVNRPGDPLNAPFQSPQGETASQPVIPKDNSAMLQYFRALRMNDSINGEDGWMAVIEYYPENDIYKPLAQIRLGLLYLKSGRYEEARPIFQELADSSQPRYKTNGYAGLMALESLAQNYKESMNYWDGQVWNHLGDLDEELRAISRLAMERNQKADKNSTKEDFDRLRREFEKFDVEPEPQFGS
ncbi:serine/threonine protein kinase [Gimesia panareensis]|uniref:non-specific serine/threonine protein kinase n=1 Tax=Gimesia panareensis TaxID=2527978 RepID=A0A517QAD9_9PLAN|nr:serine/threonine-protein kinase [Gimesia panareensis]QDT28590.1 Serine/threonine-protein kinase PrkC [Gimesia panareensis]QDU51449.1 Serine/threonine-protein kinase PrkC [Gimesia panareensis]